MDEINKEKLKELIKICPIDDRILFYFFEYLIQNYKDIELIDTIKTINNKFSMKQLYEIGKASFLYITSNNIYFKEEFKDIINEVNYNYDLILNNIYNLSKELKIKNSLELSTLFYFLLKDGYLSINKKLCYNANREILPNLSYLNIFNGNGACLEYSTMLTNLLQKSGYNSSVLINYINEYKINFSIHDKYFKEEALNIDNTQSKKNKTLIDYFLTPLIKIFSKTSNHACTLIIDNNKPYIYDSTNLLLFECIDKYKAKGILKTGHIDLNPYFSFYESINNKNSQETLRNFILRKDYTSPYNESDFLNSFKYLKKIYNNNAPLLDNFYDTINPEINNIVKKSKILTKEKLYKKR